MQAAGDQAAFAASPACCHSPLLGVDFQSPQIEEDGGRSAARCCNRPHRRRHFPRSFR